MPISRQCQIFEDIELSLGEKLPITLGHEWVTSFSLNFILLNKDIHILEYPELLLS